MVCERRSNASFTEVNSAILEEINRLSDIHILAGDSNLVSFAFRDNCTISGTVMEPLKEARRHSVDIHVV